MTMDWNHLDEESTPDTGEAAAPAPVPTTAAASFPADPDFAPAAAQELPSAPVQEESPAPVQELVGEEPTALGWTQAAIAVNSVLQLSIPMFLKMELDSHGPLLIDFRYHAFAWSTPLTDFPANAILMGLETEPTDLEAALLFDMPGQNLDGLLWLIGINSFDGQRASWLPPDGRYKLSRWPNLTQHAHTMRQMHMMAILGNAHLSTSELAAMAGVVESEAQRLINALSLMRILEHSVDVPAAIVVEPEATTKRESLFTRLRAKLGR
jgi:hypothetical protein